MIWTVAKLCSPPFGLGKATVKLTRSFNRIKPAARMTMLSQQMKLLRAEYDRAEREFRIEKQHEDARNADAIRPAAEQIQASA